MPEPDQKAWKPKANPWLIAATVALAAFMEVLDTSIANVALPHIAGSLGASQDQGTWVLTSYLVANAVILPAGAWASSVVGRRNFFLACIALFTLASLLCGLAPSLPILLVARVIQGAGGGGLQPMAQAIMADSFDEKRRGQAFALYGLVAVLAPSVGPTLGGWITDNYSWRWIFYINIPVGIVAYLLVKHLVEDPPWIQACWDNLRKLDYLGLSFLTLTMAGLQVFLDKGQEKDWFSSDFIRLFAALFAIGLIGLIWSEIRAVTPIINVRLFRFRNFAICCFLMMMVGGVLNAATVLQPQFMQELLGYTATRAGEALTGGGIALLIFMPLAGIAVGKFPARTLVVLGFALFSFGFYFSSIRISPSISFGENAFLRILQVLPIPFAFISITNAAYVGLPREASNQVSGIVNFVRNVGGSVLIALTGAGVVQRASFHQNRMHDFMQFGSLAFSDRVKTLSLVFREVTGSTTDAQYLAQASIYQQLNRQAAVLAYQDIYRALFWLSLVLMVAGLLLSKSRPGDMPPEGASFE